MPSVCFLGLWTVGSEWGLENGVDERGNRVMGLRLVRKINRISVGKMIKITEGYNTHNN